MAATENRSRISRATPMIQLSGQRFAAAAVAAARSVLARRVPPASRGPACGEFAHFARPSLRQRFAVVHNYHVPTTLGFIQVRRAK